MLYTTFILFCGFVVLIAPQGEGMSYLITFLWFCTATWWTVALLSQVNYLQVCKPSASLKMQMTYGLLSTLAAWFCTLSPWIFDKPFHWGVRLLILVLFLGQNALLEPLIDKRKISR